MATETDIQQIQAKIKPVLGKKVWHAMIGAGCAIIIDLGKQMPPKPPLNEPVGEWHIFIDGAAWRMDKDSTILVASEDPQPKLKQAIQRLEGHSLQSVDLFLPALETTFHFEDNFTLHLFPIFTEERNGWVLFMPDDYELVIGPAGNWSYQKS